MGTMPDGAVSIERLARLSAGDAYSLREALHHASITKIMANFTTDLPTKSITCAAWCKALAAVLTDSGESTVPTSTLSFLYDAVAWAACEEDAAGISLRAAVAALGTLCSAEPRAVVESVFHCYVWGHAGAAAHGEMSQSEMKHFLRVAIGVTLALTDDVAERIEHRPVATRQAAVYAEHAFDAIDKDHSRTIDREEFLAWLVTLDIADVPAADVEGKKEKTFSAADAFLDDDDKDLEFDLEAEVEETKTSSEGLPPTPPPEAPAKLPPTPPPQKPNARRSIALGLHELRARRATKETDIEKTKIGIGADGMATIGRWTVVGAATIVLRDTFTSMTRGELPLDCNAALDAMDAVHAKQFDDFVDVMTAARRAWHYTDAAAVMAQATREVAAEAEAASSASGVDATPPRVNAAAAAVKRTGDLRDRALLDPTRAVQMLVGLGLATANCRTSSTRFVSEWVRATSGLGGGSASTEQVALEVFGAMGAVPGVGATAGEITGALFSLALHGRSDVSPADLRALCAAIFNALGAEEGESLRESSFGKFLKSVLVFACAVDAETKVSYVVVAASACLPVIIMRRA